MRIKIRLLLLAVMISLVASIGGSVYRYYYLLQSGTIFESSALFLNSVYIIFGVTFFVGLFFYFIANTITSPIVRLKEEVDQITLGKLDTRLSPTGLTEVQELNISLNRILASLKLAVKKTGISKEEIGLGEALKAKELAEKEAQKRKLQLERFAKLAVGREEQMIELKKRIKELEKKSRRKK
jgi:HAMP domain-containing protein